MCALCLSDINGKIYSTTVTALVIQYIQTVHVDIDNKTTSIQTPLVLVQLIVSVSLNYNQLTHQLSV